MLKKHKFKLFLFVIIIATLFYFRSHLQKLNIKEIISSMEHSQYLPLVILGLFLLKGLVFFLPVKIIYISAGMFLPIQIAIFINLAGIILEISLTYLLGYLLGNDLVMKLIKKSKRFSQVLSYKAENEFDLTFALRLAPIAIEPVSLFMGASANNYLNYVKASLIGIFPKLLFFTLIGHVILHELNSFSILLNLILFLSWLWIIKRYKLQATFKRLVHNK